MREEIIGPHRLILGDCLEILPTLEAGSVDAVVTDPPWKASNGSRLHRKPGDTHSSVAPCVFKSTSLAYGSIGVFSTSALIAASRVTRGDMLVLCGYMELRDVLAVVKKVRQVFVWHNTRPTPIPGPVAKRDVAFIVWGGETTQVSNNGERWASCLFAHAGLQAGCMATERRLNSDGSTAHPAQEPLSLFTEMIEPLGDIVLDPHMGTGTTGVACAKTARKFIGIEIDPKYFDIACRRVTAEVKQGKFEFEGALV